MAVEAIKCTVSNVTLIKRGRTPGIAEVECPQCGCVNSYKVKVHLGEAGVETDTLCNFCGAQLAFKWEKVGRIG